MSDAPTSEPPAAFQAAFEEHLKREQEIVGMRYDDAPSVTDRGRAPGPLRHDPMEGKAFDAAKLAAAMADEQQEMQRRLDGAVPMPFERMADEAAAAADRNKTGAPVDDDADSAAAGVASQQDLRAFASASTIASRAAGEPTQLAGSALDDEFERVLGGGLFIDSLKNIGDGEDLDAARLSEPAIAPPPPPAARGERSQSKR